MKTEDLVTLLEMMEVQEGRGVVELKLEACGAGSITNQKSKATILTFDCIEELEKELVFYFEIDSETYSQRLKRFLEEQEVE